MLLRFKLFEAQGGPTESTESEDPTGTNSLGIDSMVGGQNPWPLRGSR